MLQVCIIVLGLFVCFDRNLYNCSHLWICSRYSRFVQDFLYSRSRCIWGTRATSCSGAMSDMSCPRMIQDVTKSRCSPDGVLSTTVFFTFLPAVSIWWLCAGLPNCCQMVDGRNLGYQWIPRQWRTQRSFDRWKHMVPLRSYAGALHAETQDEFRKCRGSGSLGNLPQPSWDFGRFQSSDPRSFSLLHCPGSSIDAKALWDCVAELNEEMASVQQPIEVPNFTSTGCVLFFTIAFALPHVFMSVISREVQMCVVQMSHWISQVLSNQQSDAIRLQSAIHHDPFGFGSNELSFPQGSQIICKAVLCCEPVQDSTRQTLRRTQMKWFPHGICINVGDCRSCRCVKKSDILVYSRPSKSICVPVICRCFRPKWPHVPHWCASMCIDVHRCASMCLVAGSRGSEAQRCRCRLVRLQRCWPCPCRWVEHGESMETIDSIDSIDKVSSGHHRITLQESESQMQSHSPRPL